MNQTELQKILNKQAGRNKYGNHKVCCLSKHTHDSKLEANYCNRLLAMLQAKEIKSYDVQFRIGFIVNGVPVCDHIVDFLVIGLDGKRECHDTKGMKTDVWRIKYKLFKALYPTVEYKVIEKH